LAVSAGWGSSNHSTSVSTYPSLSDETNASLSPSKGLGTQLAREETSREVERDEAENCHVEHSASQNFEVRHVGKQTRLVSNSTWQQRGYGALVLPFPLIDGSKSVFDVLSVPLLSHFRIDRSSARRTFNCQPTRSSNFVRTYLSAAFFWWGERHGALGEWRWYWWCRQLGCQIRCVSDLFLEELDGLTHVIRVPTS